MKFILSFSIPADAQVRAAAIERFQSTGGLPPPGVKLLGRWTRADLSGGYDLIESENPQAVAQFALMWSDLLDHSIAPVLEDGELAAVFKRGTA